MAQPAPSPSPLLNANPLPASESQISTANPKSYPPRPKDGARTLLDAVTAYQRRTARAERSAAQNQRPDGNSQAPRSGLTSSNHHKRAGSPSPGTASNKLAPANHPAASSRTPDRPRRNHVDSEFSRNAPIRQSEIAALEFPQKPSDPRHLSTAVGRRSGSSPHHKKNATGRNSMVGLSAAGNHSSKLFDPNARTVPISKLHNDKNRVSSLAKSSRPTNAAKAHEVEANEPGDDQDSSQSNPSPGSLVASKVQGPPPPIRGYDSHERGWKSKKVPLRGSVGEPRQLFDPRKHDPVKFAASKRTSETGPKVSLVSMSNGDTPSASLHANQGHEKHDLVYAAEDETHRSNLVANLKQAYKRLVRLETALRDEEHAAKAKDEELKAREIRESQNHSHSTANSTSALLRIHAQQKRTEEDYWVRLAKQHRELAEAHHLFLEMALDPRLPTPMHALPQKYNTPTRLWQTAFHQLLERLRHALPQLASSANADQTNQPLLEHMTDFIYFAYGFYTTLLEEQRLLPFKSVWIEQLGDLARYRMAVAGLMSKFAGSKHGRSESIKHSVVTIQTMEDEVDDDEEDESDHDVSRRSKLRSRRHPRYGEADGTSLTDGPASQLNLSSEESRSDHQPIPVPRKAAPPNAGGSIGLAALGDWEFEEQETWRATAKDWYSKGLADNPGTGRLHHHLALLSKGDELRTLYHYCKSLTAAHPYIPARESILPFFEQEQQARRSRPEVSISDLFVNLHGMLFTKIQLDDFDSELARFIEKLAEDRLLSEKQNRANHEFNRHSSVVVAQPTMSDASWVMMGTINISALLQYGAEDGVIRVAQQSRLKLSHDPQQRHLAGKGLARGLNGTSKSAPIAPQAILLSHQPTANLPTGKPADTGLRRSSQSASSDEGLSSSADNGAARVSPFSQSDHPPAANLDPTVSKNVAKDEPCQAIMIKKPDAEENDEEGGPIVFTLAAKFTFEMLKDVLLQVDSGKVCPYATMILTFLGSMCQNGRVMRKLERFIPWDQLLILFNRIPPFLASKIPSSSPEMVHQAGGSTSFRLVGFPLLEDWCLRGMDWTGKRLFPKAYWKLNKSSIGAATVDGFTEPDKTLFNLPLGNWNIESEMDVLSGLSGGLEVGCRELEDELEPQESNFPIDHSHPSTFWQYRIDMDEDANDSSLIAEQRNGVSKDRCKSEVRWMRVALVASWVAKSVPGFGCEVSPDSPEQFVISKALRQKIWRWEAEARLEEEEQRMLKSQKIGRDKRIVAIDEEIDRRDAEEDDDDDDPCDSELVRSLKARRRELKALLNQNKKHASQSPVTVPPRQARKAQPDAKAHVPGTGHQHRPSKNPSKLNALPGYTTLVFDTNILVGMLSIVKDLLESEQFIIIIPLVVITELDGLKKRANDQESQSRCLGQDALQAIKYLESSIKRYSRLLKIQTSKGNYLRDLSIRNEKITFVDHTPGTTDEGISTNVARNMDDVVLRATMWQLEHFSHRLAASDQAAEEDKPEKVVLVTLDRNLRLKARARGIVAADEKEIIGLVDSTKAKARSNLKG